MQTHNLGYPRIGANRELKKACENYWSGKTSRKNLLQVGKNLRLENWKLQQKCGIDLIPSNDFSFYDHVLDMSLTVGAIPERYQHVIFEKEGSELDLYFAMARGYQKNNLDITAMEMTKWFDTNYHYIVPEFHKDQPFKLFSTKIIDEFYEAKQAGIVTKPVILGPVSYLLLGKEKEEGFERIDLIENLLPVYCEILERLEALDVEWVQFDEPVLVMNLTHKDKAALIRVYKEIKKRFPFLKSILATYFGALKENFALASSLPVTMLHLDLVRAPDQLEEALDQLKPNVSLSLGVVDGRNIWKNDYEKSLSLIERAKSKLGAERLFLAPSCSLLHTPCDLSLETDEKTLPQDIKNWMAFAKQKLEEVVVLSRLANDGTRSKHEELLEENKRAIAGRNSSILIHQEQVKERVRNIASEDGKRKNPFHIRRGAQAKSLQLPLLPTTTIGSFPQVQAIRKWRAKYRKAELTLEEYNTLIGQEIQEAIQLQEEIGLDVLVHGEFERNDMVEYFGEKLAGFAFTKNGWVQSYGSRCVKPPIIYGDVHRPAPMTVDWSTYAQSLTKKPVKGMLTGPVTILQWSFVRDDQPRSETALQIAMAIRDEVKDLEKAGIKIIQIDEPAIREGLPLRREDWDNYLQWAIRAFKISSSIVSDSTQIHTHMCYSEFNDIIEHIANMDADVITIECSRSQMELLDAFAEFKYPNEIGPGVYDIHSPRIPTKSEMVALLEKAETVIAKEQLWVNPDCGLKTRGWEETKKALIAMVQAAKALREQTEVPFAYS